MGKTTIVVFVAALTLAAPLAFASIEPTDLVERDVARPVGIEKHLTLMFGPFAVPPGQDINRFSFDLPLYDGFITAIAPNLIDAATGETPSDQVMHIHHAHWFRVSDDPADEYYTLNLAWVFGTGEEKTQGSFTNRAAADPAGPRYGIFIPGGQPQTYIYMLHNKEASAKNMYITLDVDFVYGTRDSILAAKDCGPLPLLEGERCVAGADFHELKGKLWGTTFNVPRDFGDGDGTYVHPADIPLDTPERLPTDDMGRMFVAPHDGTLVAGAGHMHPNGREVVIANLGPEGSACDGDLDNDGFPGVTLFHSRKIDRDPRAAPYSEDFQMAATKFGFRAPVREGDRLTQFAVYDNSKYAAYAAMSYVGIYVDRLAPPAPRGDEGCTLENTRAYFAGAPEGDVREGIQSRAWTYLQPLCGLPTTAPCDVPEAPLEEGIETPVVHIAAFAYLPGDRDFTGAAGAPPKVRAGQSLTFVNDDVIGGIRHTVTSCEWPCNGPYVANYPNPDGVFDSGKMANLDYIDGGIVGTDTSPVWSTPTDLPPGMYSYYCRIHPDMRGTFEVI
ncbi:MAG TPA: hypothetical protein VM370_02035 [Candidatus Thermoplasmatota archaeon]|nr:hypothetical protein [Candidatus Thermoplasmatota archaeon]